VTTQRVIDRAHRALPYLVHFAKSRRAVTYGQLSGLIGVHWRTASDWLGYIRDEICIPRGLPLLTAIVVNKQTRLPGDNWLPEGTENLSAEEYRKKYIIFREQVSSHSGWEALLQDLGIPPLSLEAVQAADKILD
jgi:hypothetical protein